MHIVPRADNTVEERIMYQQPFTTPSVVYLGGAYGIQSPAPQVAGAAANNR